MLFIILLVALNLSLVTNGLKSSFLLEGDLICSQHKLNYRMNVIEEDNIFDDIIGTTGVVYSSSPHRFNVSAVDDGDGNNFYEIALEIVHNCNTDEKRFRKYFHSIGEYPIIDG
ncbi:hypothetical protein GCK72_023626 [Caenorhabditis remanei]|uniref:Uncharacterized protein n=1 Tax=Caenorhabditis remanei TaxID=31234 RepID=A0A6A5FXC4_CAERE|nr:hypothetical protein GCK72_023626 [Caenorhabditis remanei]KAF1747165.1 hypothetical protein GCK72_023626 [Caenorhabditis remanei]